MLLEKSNQLTMDENYAVLFTPHYHVTRPQSVCNRFNAINQYSPSLEFLCNLISWKQIVENKPNRPVKLVEIFGASNLGNINSRVLRHGIHVSKMVNRLWFIACPEPLTAHTFQIPSSGCWP